MYSSSSSAPMKGVSNRSLTTPSPTLMTPDECSVLWSASLDSSNEAEICTALTLLKSRKAPGPDCFPPSLFKVAEHDVIEKLTHVFSKVKEVLLDWTESIVLAVFGRGLQTVRGHHREVSVLRCLRSLGLLFSAD